MYINLLFQFPIVPHRPEPFSRDYKGKSPAEISWRAHADAVADVNPNGLPLPVAMASIDTRHFREQPRESRAMHSASSLLKSEQIDANAY